jgi:single-strand DNA-binding protein
VWNSKSSQLADIVERYLRKGDKVYVEGRIEYRQWQDKENQTRYTTEINIRELIMLSGRSGGGQDMEGGAPAGARSGGARPPRASSGSGGGNDFDDFQGTMEEEDDDLPF